LYHHCMDGLPIAKLLSQAIRKMHPVFHLMAATPKGQTWHNTQYSSKWASEAHGR
jgi:hypothetical protein